MQRSDTGLIEFEYFCRPFNQTFYKLRNSDTLLYQNYDARASDLDSILSIQWLKNTDTILGKICNRIVLHTRSMQLTVAYCPDLPTNPDWYKNTEGGYYNVIYGQTKAHYLLYILETDKTIYKGVATKIVTSEVPISIFPNVVNAAKVHM